MKDHFARFVAAGAMAGAIAADKPEFAEPDIYASVLFLGWFACSLYYLWKWVRA